MEYTITIERATGLSMFDFGWHWKVEANGYTISDFAFTKRGAIWAANRTARSWAREAHTSTTAESWTVSL